ncbi:MAG TPA: MXAN_5187 family protein [Polyangia bacterium]
MFLSKIWFVLIGLLAGAATTAAFVAPRSADRRIVELEGQRLDRAQYAADQMLKTDAHAWIDYATKLSRDAILADSLDSASKGLGEARLLTDTVRARLKTLVPDLAGIGLDGIGAVDARGRVVARIGEREADAGDSLAGIEVVGDALRGYLSDDVWGAGGKLQRVAAVPVLSKARDRIVGALFVGIETGKRLAEVWKKNLGVDIAILLRGQIQTSTVPESFLANLPTMIEERANEIKEAKRTRPVQFDVGSDRLLAVAAPFIGQAAEQGAYFVLIGKMSPASDPLALLSTTTADDLKWGHFPWLGLGIGLAVILGVGLFLQHHESEKPLSKLRAEVQKLARGEVQKLDDHAYPGKFGGIARDVNAAMERFTLAQPARSETARKDLDAILGSAPPASQPASVFDLPQSHFGPLGGNQPVPPPAFPGPGGGGFPPPGGGFPPPSSGGAFAGGGLAAPGMSPPRSSGASGLPAPAFPGGPKPRETTPPPFSPGFGAPPPVPARGRTGGTPAPTLQSRSEAALAALEPNGAAGTAVVGGPSPQALASTLPMSGLDAIESSGDFGGPTRQDENLLDEAGYDQHVREVYDEYLRTRERCGEPLGSLTEERFRAKLDANRQQLVMKYGCRSARFSVYVKDGKAAIKATPVR